MYAIRSYYAARALTAALGLASADATLCFQSRFGPEPWLGPTTFDTLRTLAERGVRAVAVVTPGFLTEGLETLRITSYNVCYTKLLRLRLHHRDVQAEGAARRRHLRADEAGADDHHAGATSYNFV